MTELYRIEARECQIWMHLFVSAGSLDRYADPVGKELYTSTYTGLTGLSRYKRITSLDRTASTKELLLLVKHFKM